MSFTDHELWGLIHGMGLGTLFLLAFAGGLADLFGLERSQLTGAGLRGRVRRLRIGVPAMAVAAWLTVITGTWTVYPWYRDRAATSPRSRLLADPATADWHHFGMEWKEHVAWLSPILATAVAFVVLYYGERLAGHPRVRRVAIALFVSAFVLAAVAGAFGAFITKAAPV